jgi:hypothetical protein
MATALGLTPKERIGKAVELVELKVWAKKIEGTKKIVKTPKTLLKNDLFLGDNAIVQPRIYRPSIF